MKDHMNIELLTSRAARGRLEQLIDLLTDAVDSGASVGFLPPLGRDEALEYWLGIIGEIDAGGRLLLAALRDDDLVGSVQLELASKANARHRAEVQRLIVHRSARRQGIGQRLMQELETAAVERGRTLLVLDTREGDASELLYRKLGYVRGGAIPGYARSADGALDATVFYYRELDASPPS
jgi:ribosomal protein S18 acetylase RimI-like enzyme